MIRANDQGLWLMRNRAPYQIPGQVGQLVGVPRKYVPSWLWRMVKDLAVHEPFRFILTRYP